MIRNGDNEMDVRDIRMRYARRGDVAAIVEMLADDELGRTRENIDSPPATAYFEAFKNIDSDPTHELVVACIAGEIVGVLQLNILFYLTHQGSKRALIEGVRVARKYRSGGVGRIMFEWAIARAKESGCGVVQLTTDKTRTKAKGFYERLGFVASHEGMKLDLTRS